MTIQWTDLIPQDEIDILANPPSYISDIEDGSLEDQIGSQAKILPYLKWKTVINWLWYRPE